jgi:uncharacterized membrane protein
MQRAAAGHRARAPGGLRARLKLPTLLVRGGLSDVLTEEGAQTSWRCAPTAEYVNVTDAGHMVAGDRNDIFGNAVIEFLARVVPVCVMLMISMLGLFSALTMSPISMVTALSFVSPVFASVVAILVLRERSSARRWFAVAGGIVGMLLIVRPGVVPLSLGPVLAICGAIAWAVSIIVIKMMSTTESSTTQVTYMSVIVTPLTFLLAVWVWKWPSLQLLPVLVFMAFIATVGQFAYTKSFKYAEATALMPLDCQPGGAGAAGPWPAARRCGGHAVGNRPEAFLITAAAYVMGLRLTWVNPTSSEDDHAYILQTTRA